RRPLVLEQPIHDLVNERAIGVSVTVAYRGFEREPEPLGDRAAAAVVGSGLDLDPVELTLAEPVLDEPSARLRAQPAALEPAHVPVAELSGMHLHVDPETDVAHVLLPDPDAVRVSVRHRR